MVDRSSPSHVINNSVDRKNVRLDGRGDDMFQSQEDFKHTVEPQIILPPIGRPSRAFRHFQNPPQPHMCIRHHTVDGQELFINVMSWTRIVMPQNADEPIPLYGGMRVPPSSSRSPPLVYAVMANPEILRHVGRNCPDPEKRLAVVELMCEFVEAMNPGLKLARDAEVLKDRDLSGELKDIWGAVQAKREREKEGPASYAAPSYENHMAAQSQVTYMEFGPDTSFQKQQPPPGINPNTTPTIITPSAITNNFEQLNGKPNDVPKIEVTSPDVTDSLSNDGSQMRMNSSGRKNAPKDVDDAIDGAREKKTDLTISMLSSINATTPINNTTTIPDKQVSIPTTAPIAASKTLPVVTVATPIAPQVTTPPTSTKKEKLGGFLPNGCHNIFPFIKSKSSHSKKEPKEKKGTTKTGIIDFTKNGQWRSNSNANDQSTGGAVKTIINTGKIGDVPVSKSDLGENNKIPHLHDNNIAIKDDSCVDKMQKLKL